MKIDFMLLSSLQHLPQLTWNVTLVLIEDNAMDGQVFELRSHLGDQALGDHLGAHDQHQRLGQAGG